MRRPLADEIRPQTLDEVVGQKHLLGESAVLRRLIESGSSVNMVFYGPPGTGKTTVANLIAQRTNKTLHRLNATTASLQDIKDIIADVGTLLAPGGILLYLDEIQYFNKKQQQSLLEYLEDGRITLIASTTENPYYYIYDALLSRCSVFEFRHVTAADILARLQRVAAERYPQLTFADGVLAKLADASGGDVRRGLTLLEVASRLGEEADGGKIVSRDAVDALVPEGYLSNFDRDGDVHYDLLSCLQKSIRGSDPDAAVFYLAKLLEGGDLISPCRRLLVIASEDIGPAYPMAAVIVRACVESARELGLPEARLPLANAAVILATAPKSNSAHDAINAAIEDIHKGLGSDIPTHLRSPQFRGYKYPHDYPDHYVKQDYLPADLRGRRYYEFGENKTEQAARAYWQKIKGEDV